MIVCGGRPSLVGGDGGVVWCGEGENTVLHTCLFFFCSGLGF